LRAAAGVQIRAFEESLEFHQLRQPARSNCKIVYYGAGLGGKTTNLQVIYQKTAETSRRAR